MYKKCIHDILSSISNYSMGRRRIKKYKLSASSIDSEGGDVLDSSVALSRNPNEAKFIAAEIGSSAEVLDLHGCNTELALHLTEKFLNDATMGRIEYAKIIHGAGAGTLRRAVQEYLSGHSLVKDFRAASYPHETAITIVILHSLSNKK